MESIDKIESILNGDGYFRCERNHARISIETCVKRQKENKVAKMYGYEHPDCMKCEQGEENMKGLENGRVEERKSGRVDGTGKEAKPLCKCGKEAKNPHNAKVYKWCGECWGKLLSEGRKKMDAKEKMEEMTTETKPHNRRPQQQASACCSGLKPAVEPAVEIVKDGRIVPVDFGGYPELLKDVKAEANREVRSTEQQIIYLLKRWKRVFVDSGDSDEIK